MADNWQLKAVISANAEGMIKTLKTVNAMTKDTRKYLSDVASSAGKVSSKIGLPFAALGGLLAGFGVAKIKDAVQGFGEMGEAIYKGSLRAGMSVEEYQRMKYVAEQAGVGVEALEGSMGKLNKNTYAAANGGNKNIAALYKAMGISMKDSSGQVRSAVDLLPELADAFKRNTNESTRAAMSNTLFGKSWQEIAPLLSEGSAGITESLERMKRLKGVMGADDINGAREFGKTMKDVDIVMKGFSNMIAKALVPVLQPMINDFVAWFAINKKLIAQPVGEMAKDFGKYLRTIDFQAVLKGVDSFVRGLGSFIDMVGGAKNALIGLVLFMNIETIVALYGVVAGVVKAGIAFVVMAAQAYVAGNAGLLNMMRIAIVAVATAGPIGAIGAAFAWVGTAAAASGGIISGAMGMVSVAIRGIGAALLANPLGIILGLATAAVLIYQNWDTLKVWFTNFFGWIGDKFQAIVGWASDLAQSVGSIFGSSSGASPSSGNAPASGGRSSLVAPQSKGRVDGQVNIKIDGLPPGSRVDQLGSGTMPINLDAGFSSFATGMPY